MYLSISAMALLSFMFVAVGTSVSNGKHLYAAGMGYCCCWDGVLV